MLPMHSIPGICHACRYSAMCLQYKVKDMTQADFGRLEIEIAEAEMPGLIACRSVRSELHMLRHCLSVVGVEVVDLQCLLAHPNMLLRTRATFHKRRSACSNASPLHRCDQKSLLSQDRIWPLAALQGC